MLAIAVFMAALLIGTSGISLREALAALSGAGDETARAVMLEVRLPRLLAAFGVGGLLADRGRAASGPVSKSARRPVRTRCLRWCRHWRIAGDDGGSDLP